MSERLERWRASWSEPTEGWDVDGDGVQESEPPWSYIDLVRHEFSQAGSALDVGTGGGEFLLSVRDALPVEMHATEGWPPNLPVARKALEPLGVEVRQYDSEQDERMPYSDGSVDLIINRHESYVAAEIARVLRPGGWFLTQQVDGHNLDDLGAVFGADPPYPEVTLQVMRAEAEEAGFVIERAEEWSGPITFEGVEALVRYLRWMPWQLPADFTIDAYADELLALDDRGGPLEFTERRFVLLAHLPTPEVPPADPFAAAW